MTESKFDFEGGSNGLAITGSAVGTGAANPVVDAGGSATFQSGTPYQGLLFARYSYPVGGTTGVLQSFSLVAPNALVAATFAFRLGSDLAGATTANICSFRSSGGQVFSIRVVWSSGTPTLHLFNSSNVDLGQIGTGSLTEGSTWYRVSLQINGTTGAITVRLRNGLTDALIGSAFTITDAGLVGTFTQVRVGIIGTVAANCIIDVDYLVLNDGATTEIAAPVDQLPSPSSVIVGYTNPTTIGGTDGSITIEWAAVPGAHHYEAALENGSVTSGFTADDTNATSPKTFTGLAAGTYTVAVRAKAS